MIIFFSDGTLKSYYYIFVVSLLLFFSGTTSTLLQKSSRIHTSKHYTLECLIIVGDLIIVGSDFKDEKTIIVDPFDNSGQV